MNSAIVFTADDGDEDGDDDDDNRRWKARASPLFSSSTSTTITVADGNSAAHGTRLVVIGLKLGKINTRKGRYKSWRTSYSIQPMNMEGAWTQGWWSNATIQSKTEQNFKSWK